MRVLFLASEVAPWSKTGGLGDVCGALPQALQAEHGVQVGVFTPLYDPVRAVLDKKQLALDDTGVTVDLGAGLEGRWFALRRAGEPDTFFLACDPLYGRDGIYGYSKGSAYGIGGFSDNTMRYAALCRGAVAAAARLMGGPIDVVHAHDWQAGLAIGLARHLDPRPRTVLTIHNLAHQGMAAMGDAVGCGITRDEAPEGYWTQGIFNALRGAIAHADAVTTVSPTYAREIQTPEFGMGLDGLLVRRGVTGIVNGLDTDEWDPATDRHLPTTYTADAPGGKKACRRALLREVGLPDEPGVPVLGVVSRFDPQKGLDVVAQVAARLPRLPARLVVLGTGASVLEEQFRALGAHHRNHIAARIEFDIGLAHRIVAGSDVLLVPSRFEPCGLTQLQAMRYGAVPLVHAVGGLADTVLDPGDEALMRGEGTGFSFRGLTAEHLYRTLERAVALYRADVDGWGRLQAAGLRRDSTWTASAAAWAGLYRAL